MSGLKIMIGCIFDLLNTWKLLFFFLHAVLHFILLIPLFIFHRCAINLGKLLNIKSGDRPPEISLDVVVTNGKICASIDPCHPTNAHHMDTHQSSLIDFQS